MCFVLTEQKSKEYIQRNIQDAENYPSKEMTLIVPSLNKFPLKIIAVIAGASGTPYEGGIFHFQIIYDTYKTRIRLVCLTKIYHLNFSNQKDLSKSLMVYHQERMSNFNCKGLILAISRLLRTPDMANDRHIPRQMVEFYHNNRNEFDKIAKEWTVKYAMPSPSLQ